MPAVQVVTQYALQIYFHELTDLTEIPLKPASYGLQIPPPIHNLSSYKANEVKAMKFRR